MSENGAAALGPAREPKAPVRQESMGESGAWVNQGECREAGRDA